MPSVRVCPHGHRLVPVVRVGLVKRGAPLARKPMKRGKGRKPSMAGFWVAVTEDGQEPCALAYRGRWTNSGCDGPLDAHHFILKQRLPTDAAKTDSRNGPEVAERLV